jgi:hypothetical protein
MKEHVGGMGRTDMRRFPNLAMLITEKKHFRITPRRDRGFPNI